MAAVVGTPWNAAPRMTADTVQPAGSPDPAIRADRGRVARHQAVGEPAAGNRAGARPTEGSEPAREPIAHLASLTTLKERARPDDTGSELFCDQFVEHPRGAIADVIPSDSQITAAATTPRS